MSSSAAGPVKQPLISFDLSGREFSRILLIKPSSPGDIIHALPVLRGLRERFPRAHIAWLAASPYVNLVDADPALSEVIPFDRAHFARIGRNWRATVDFFGFARSLRARKFDLVIDLQGLLRSGFMSLFSGAPERIGFRDSRELAWLFYNRRIPRLPADMHAADKLFVAARVLGLEDAPRDFRIAITPQDRARADELLAQAGVAAGGRFAVLVPGTRWETKRWPVERFGELARVLHARHGLPSVFVGAASDRDDANRALAHQSRALPDQSRDRKGAAGGKLKGGFESEPRNLCGKTTFRELAAIIDRAVLVVTADSAPMHIAAAHGRPLVAMFGPTNPQRTGPHGQLESVVRLPLACSPCYLRRLSQCPFEHKCMEDLSVEMVAAQVIARLSEPR